MSRKQTILQVAADIFSEQGYRETSMSEIARRAGVADGTVFYNFQSKETLYLAVLEEFRGKVHASLDRYMAESRFATGLDMVEGLVGFYISLAEEMAARFLLLHRYDPYKIARTNPAFRKHLEEIYDCIVDAFEKAIRRGQRDGSVLDGPARKQAFVVFASVDGLVRLKTFSLYRTETLYGELMACCRRMLGRGQP